jgi:hypothetical protein
MVIFFVFCHCLKFWTLSFILNAVFTENYSKRINPYANFKIASFIFSGISIVDCVLELNPTKTDEPLVTSWSFTVISYPKVKLLFPR